MYKPTFFMLAALTALAGGPSARAQAVSPIVVPPPMAVAPPPAAAPAPASYRLGADDMVSIQVLNFPELCVPQITIPPDGRITVPLLGSLPVAGRTTAQVQKTLTTRWNGYVVDPLVTVTLTQRRKESVHVYGFVAHVQTVDYKTNLSLMQALAQAGGAADNGDLSHVTVTHGDGRKQTVDVRDPQAAGGTAQDLTLAPDDVVYVPERHIQITVLGEVAKPGIYDYRDKMTVLEALKSADNVNPETADLSNATLLHNGKESRLDLNALLHGERTADNVALSPDDRIFIPTLHNRVYVDGAIGHPGYYAFKPGDRLADAINGSGGTTAGVSDLAKVSVIHVDKVRNTARQQTVDYFKFLEHADMQANIPLAPGDAIYVPLKGKHSSPFEALGSVLGLATGFRVLGGR